MAPGIQKSKIANYVIMCLFNEVTKIIYMWHTFSLEAISIPKIDKNALENLIWNNGRHFASDSNVLKTAAISQTTFSNAFSLMKMFNLQWKLFLRIQLTINQHWFMQWLVACSAPSHYHKPIPTQFANTYLWRQGQSLICSQQTPGTFSRRTSYVWC